EHDSAAVQAFRSGAQDYLIKGKSDPALLHRSIRHAIARKAFDARLAERANFDPLTGLVNRALFDDRVRLAIARATRARSRIGLLYIDLDGFKAINDTQGHAAGDDVLRRVAHRLRDSVRSGESVSRRGGDEFTVLLDP